MSTYREIVGKKIRKVTSDPSTGIDGQMWYNSTTGSIRGLAVLEAWTSSAPMSTAMDQLGGTGTQTAALAGAGGGLTTFEEYDGSGWAAGGAIPTAMELIQQLAGTQTAAICKGGLTPPPGARYNNEAYTYNGSAWSSIPDSGDVRIRGAAAGTQTAFLIAGGASGPPTFTNRLSSSEEYDGSSWTEGGSMSTAREFLSGFGTQTAAIMAGGSVPPSYGNSNASEQYNGTAFSSTPNINTARYGLAGSGTSTSNLIYGGGTGSNSAATESYDGTSWSNKPSMSTARIYLTRAGDSSSSALASAGNSGSAVGTTEEFTASTNVITAAAWASGGNYPSSVQGMGVAGTQTATVSAGGAGPTNLACTYDGSSWTTITNYPQSVRDVTGTGVQTAGFMISGYGAPPPTGGREKTNYWNGSAWVAGGDLNNSTTRQLGGSAGVLTAALFWGGDGGTPITAFESYNGSAWTALTAAPFGGNSSGCGTSTAALATPGPSVNSYEWGGSSWTAGGNMPVANQYANLTGTQTDAIHYGGYVSSAYYAGAIGYDGTTWSTRPSMATARGIIGHGTAGTSTSALATAGYAGPGGQNATEEFTGETTAGNIKTFSTS